jgi:hypothetical protein
MKFQIGDRVMFRDASATVVQIDTHHPSDGFYILYDDSNHGWDVGRAALPGSVRGWWYVSPSLAPMASPLPISIISMLKQQEALT